MGRERERERESTLAPPFICFFFSTWACPMQIGLSQECCLFCLKSSLWSSDLPCLLATAILDSFSLFYLPNTLKWVCVYIYTHTHTYMILGACLVSHSCPTLCNPIDCSPPGSSVHGILQDNTGVGV